MKKTIMLFCLTCLFFNLFGQEVLVLTKKENGKEKIINQNEKIRIKTNSGNVYKGYFTIKNDTLTILGEGKIYIQDIKMIVKKSAGKKGFIGSLAVITGVSALAINSIGFALINEAMPLELVHVISHPVIFIPAIVTVTGIVLLSSEPHFKKDKWDYSVRTLD